MRLRREFNFNEWEHLDAPKIYKYVASGRKTIGQKLHELLYGLSLRKNWGMDRLKALKTRRQILESSPKPFASTLATGIEGRRAEELKKMLFPVTRGKNPERIVVSVREDHYPIGSDLSNLGKGRHYTLSFFPKEEDFLEHDFEPTSGKPRIRLVREDSLQERRARVAHMLDEMESEVGEMETPVIEGTLGHIVINVDGKRAAIAELKEYEIEKGSSKKIAETYPNWQEVLKKAAELFCKEKGFSLPQAVK